MDKKAIFWIDWIDGVPSFPPNVDIIGYSADQHVTRQGLIKCWTWLSQAHFVELKQHRTFVRDVEESGL